jgi:hypothetical protein
MNSEDKVLVTFDLDNDVYFGMLKYCADNRISLDDFVEMALRSYLDKPKKKKK